MCSNHAEYPESCGGKEAKPRKSVRGSCSKLYFRSVTYDVLTFVYERLFGFRLIFLWIFELFECVYVCMCICTSPPPCAVPLRFLYTLAVFCSRLLVLSSTQSFANSSGIYFYLSSLSFFSFQTFFLLCVLFRFLLIASCGYNLQSRG